MVAAAWWAEQFQASEVQPWSLPLPGSPTPTPPSGTTMGPSSTHLMGDLMQEDGHGGQETDLQEGESMGVVPRARAPTCSLIYQYLLCSECSGWPLFGD